MWHNLSTKDVEIKLETNLKDGLTDEEVAERLKNMEKINSKNKRRRAFL